MLAAIAVAEWFAELEPVASAQDCACHCQHGASNFLQTPRALERGVLEYKIDFGPAIACTSGETRHDRHLAHGRYEEAASTGYRYGKGVLAGLQAEQARTALREWRDRLVKTGSFKELVQTRVKNDKKFAEALLREGIDAMLSGDVETARRSCVTISRQTVGLKSLPSDRDAAQESYPNVRSAR